MKIFAKRVLQPNGIVIIFLNSSWNKDWTPQTHLCVKLVIIHNIQNMFMIFSHSNEQWHSWISLKGDKTIKTEAAPTSLCKSKYRDLVRTGATGASAPAEIWQRVRRTRPENGWHVM